MAMCSWSAPSILLIITAVAAPTAVVCFLSRLLMKKRDAVKFRSPPGPPGLPILGNILKLWGFPHRTLQKLVQEYGPIMGIRLGFLPVVVVSSSHAAELFLTTHNLSFAQRSIGDAGEYLLGMKGVVTTEYGPHWQSVLKVCNVHVFCSRKVDALRPVRTEEIRRFIHSIRDAAAGGGRVPVDLGARVSALAFDVACLSVFGKRCGEVPGLEKAIRETQELLGSFNLNDYFPGIGVLDVQGFRRRMKSVRKAYDDLIDPVIDEHALSLKEGWKLEKDFDFLDVMLSSRGSGDENILKDRRSIKDLILDVVFAAVDTPEAWIGRVMMELLRHPRVMTKVQQELQVAVGRHRMVEEDDLESLPYLGMVLKESMRLHPAAHLLERHCREDCVVGGFKIRKGTRLLVNLGLISRDPADWEDADAFFPERFTGCSGGAGEIVNRQGVKFLAFGAGSRRCPGIYMALTFVKFVVAQLVHCFDWESVVGVNPHGDLGTAEPDYGASPPSDNHMLAVPAAYRLQSGVA